jgi:hypothetical protein
VSGELFAEALRAALGRCPVEQTLLLAERVASGRGVVRLQLVEYGNQSRFSTQPLWPYRIRIYVNNKEVQGVWDWSRTAGKVCFSRETTEEILFKLLFTDVAVLCVYMCVLRSGLVYFKLLVEPYRCVGSKPLRTNARVWFKMQCELRQLDSFREFK